MMLVTNVVEQGLPGHEVGDNPAKLLGTRVLLVDCTNSNDLGVRGDVGRAMDDQRRLGQGCLQGDIAEAAMATRLSDCHLGEVADGESVSDGSRVESIPTTGVK